MREGWTYKTFGEVGSFLRGKSIQKADFIENGFPCIHYGQIHTKFGVSVDKHLSEIPLELYNKSIIASHGDVIIAITSEDLEGSCKSTAWLGDYDVAVSSHAAVYKHNINPKFIAYYLRSKSFYYEKMKYARGFKVVEIKPTDIERIPIPVPPIAEQERIVAELDLLQGIIEKKKEQLKAYDQLAQSIFYTIFGDPIDNPKGWEVKYMNELFDIGSSKRVFESQWQNEGIPFYRAREIVKFAKNEPIDSPIFVSEELYSEYAGKYGVPSKGDIMVTAVGTLGVCYIVKAEDRFYFKDGNILWFKSKGLCESRFIKDQYATPFVMDQIQGNANAAVVGTYTITNAKKTKVIVPPLQLQKDYVQEVEAIEQQKGLVQRSIEETQTMFDYTMDKYFG